MQALFAQHIVTHRVLGKHQGAHALHDVLALDAQVHQLHGGKTFTVEDNTTVVAEVDTRVTRIGGAAHIVLDLIGAEQRGLRGRFIGSRKVVALQDTNA